MDSIRGLVRIENRDRIQRPPYSQPSMERQDERELAPEGQPSPAPEKRPYETPKVESVQLSKEAAESLT